MTSNLFSRFKPVCMFVAGVVASLAWSDDSFDHVDEALVIDVKTGETVEYSGCISGTSSITKSGDGTLVLSNPYNNFTGGINLQRGYLKATAAGAR